jgi:hypothetical protein
MKLLSAGAENGTTIKLTPQKMKEGSKKPVETESGQQRDSSVYKRVKTQFIIDEIENNPMYANITPEEMKKNR